MKYLLLIFFSLIGLCFSACNGVPLKEINGHDFNCYSLCCPKGFVQSADYEGNKCVPCASVGLLRCAACALYAVNERGINSTYRCLQSQNIQNLVTRGSISKCYDGSGAARGGENVYILNNYTNYNQCIRCYYIIAFAEQCEIVNHCNLTLSGNIGNQCVPQIRVTKCNRGFAPTDDRTFCQVCSAMISGCRQCLNSTFCTSCDRLSNFTLSQNGTCVCTQQNNCHLCPQYMYYNQTTQQCKCASPFYLQDGKCLPIMQCGINQAFYKSNLTCVCKINFVMTDTGCQPLTCSQNQIHLIQTGECICKLGYTRINSICTLDGGFKAATYMYNVQYTSNNYTMVNTLYEYKCGCPAGFSFENGRCVPCSIIGKQCQCAEGWYYNSSKCFSCAQINLPGCLSCDQQSNKCNRCIPGTALNYLSTCSQCMQYCSECDAPDGDIRRCFECKSASIFYGNSLKICVKCEQIIRNCIACYQINQGGKLTKQSYRCSSCQYPYVPTADNKHCVCPGSNSTAAGCIPCHFGCISCNSGICLQCRPGMILNSVTNNCDCQSSDLSVNTFCQNCKINILAQNIQGCLTCSHQIQCQNCTKGYLQIYGSCELCTRFIPGCIDCNTTSTCQVCDSSNNYILVGTQCACQSPYFMIEGTCKLCSQFITGCLQCVGVGQCTRCNASAHYQFNNNSCTCSVGYKQNQKQCVPCNQFIQGCTSCQTNNSTCLECGLGYALNSSGSCECASGFIIVSGGCIQCSLAINHCKTCNSTNCIACKQYYVLNQTSGTCHLSSQLTSGCPSKACDQCINGTCTQCKIGAQMQLPGKCQCLPGYFLNASFDCQKCDQNERCAYCESDEFCIQCVHQSFLPWTCTCPDGKYDMMQRAVCVDCPYYCKTCSNYDTCTSCQQNLNRQVVDGKCLCKPGFISNWPGDPSTDPTKCSPI